MLLQTNSYIVPKEKREAHARLMRRFRQTLQRLGCEHFEVYEQVGSNWNSLRTGTRFVQMMRFRDRRQHQAVQDAERNDPAAQELIREFCELIGFADQQAQGQFVVGYYGGVLAEHLDLAPASENDQESAAASHDFTTADLPELKRNS